MTQPARLLVGTRKGLLQFTHAQGAWHLTSEWFPGVPVPYACQDPRSGFLWASLDHGHWGPKLHYSQNDGQSWDEVQGIKYPADAETKPGVPASLELIWFIAPGGNDEPERLYLGTNPGGLLVSDDGGKTFALNRPLWDIPARRDFWFGGGRDSAGLSSVFVDPRQSQRLVVGASCGGVYVSEDKGQTWEPRNRGLKASFLPDPYAEHGHDPHFMTYCQQHPEVWWQQNHCGIFMTRDAGRHWQEVSQPHGPARFGWAIAVDEQRPDTAWVVPSVADDMRLAADRALCVCRTDDGGNTWQDLRVGLPQRHAYDIVYRHALDHRAGSLAFGSTTGNLYASGDGGLSWQTVSHHLPPVYSVRFV